MKTWATAYLVAGVTMATAGSATGATCTTPAAVAAAFANGETCVVDSCLHGVITADDPAPTHPYPAGFGKAWLAGYRTVADILETRRDRGATCHLTDRALAQVGFPRPYDRAPYRFHVIDGCALESAGHFIAVPTVAEWVRVLMDGHGIAVPMAAFRALAETGRDFPAATGCTGGTDPVSGKALDALACVTGPGFPEAETCGCHPDFLQAYRTLHGLSPYEKGQTSAACFAAFEAMERSALTLRAALWACQDANPYNTFNGLSFDGANLTLPEFIFDNVAFAAMPSGAVAHRDLPDPAACAPR